VDLCAVSASTASTASLTVIGDGGASAGSSPSPDGLGRSVRAIEPLSNLLQTRVFRSFSLRCESERPTSPSGRQARRPFRNGGLDYLNNRYHDPTLGRFISVDPIVGLTHDAYGYGNGNPTTYSDPSGLCAEDTGGAREACSRTPEQQASDTVTRTVNNGRQGDDFNLASNWGELGLVAGPADSWNPGGADICFGALACREAEAHFNKHPKDIAGAKRIAATFCLDHMSDCERYMGASGMRDGMYALGMGILAVTATGGSVFRSGRGGLYPGEVPCASFRADTLVVMADGTRKRIGDVEVGDWVLATDPVTGKTSFRVVTATMVHDDDDLLDLVVRTDHGLATIHTTDHHRIWDVTRRSWSLAADLSVGDELQTAAGGRSFVEQLIRVPGHSPMLDLTIDIDHTFYVDGGLGTILVHNANCVSDVLSELPKGDQAHVRTVGSQAELETLWDALTTDAATGAWKGYDGLVAVRSDGTQVGIRWKSGSGGATIDVHYPDGTIQKVHIV
jgi:RHS repeat-associated protein